MKRGEIVGVLFVIVYEMVILCVVKFDMYVLYVELVDEVVCIGEDFSG